MDDLLNPATIEQAQHLLFALIARKAGSAAIDAVWKRMMLLDPAGNATKTLLLALQRAAGADTYHGLDPGMLTLLVRATSTVDDDQYRNYWANLIHAGVTGSIGDSDLRWAAGVLERLVPADALALALCIDPTPRMRRTGMTRHGVLSAMTRLEVQGLVRRFDAGRTISRDVPIFADCAESGRFRPGQQSFVERFLISPGPGDIRNHVALVERWAVTPLGSSLAAFAQVEPLPSYGEFDPMVQVMDDAFFDALADGRGSAASQS